MDSTREEPIPSTSRNISHPNNNYYSIVIETPDEEITESTIQPKVIKMFPNQQPHYDTSGNPFLEYYDQETYGDITDAIVIHWSTPLHIYNELKPENRSKINQIKNYINGRASALCYHNGNQDDCTFHSIHYHLIVKLQTKEHHLTSNYAFKQLKKNLEPWTVHTQKIQQLGNYALFLTKPPRKYQGTNNTDIKLQLLQTKAAKNSTTTTTTTQESKKKPKLYNDIENLLKLMNKYNSSEKNQLITNVYNSSNQQDKDTLTDLIRAVNWNLIYKRSQEEFIHKIINPG